MAIPSFVMLLTLNLSHFHQRVIEGNGRAGDEVGIALVHVIVRHVLRIPRKAILRPRGLVDARRRGPNGIVSKRLAAERSAIVEDLHRIAVLKPALGHRLRVQLDARRVELREPRRTAEVGVHEESRAGLGKLQRILFHERIAVEDLVVLLPLGSAWPEWCWGS